MNAWKLRLIVLGFANAIIAVVFGAVRGYSELIIAYICVGILIGVIGIVWHPKEKTQGT
jgi:hypothetical protein